MTKNNTISGDELELVIGIVAPIGTKREYFIEKLRVEFEQLFYKVEVIDIVESFIEIHDEDNELPNSLKTFLKMQACSLVRNRVAKGYFAGLAIRVIRAKRNNSQGARANKECPGTNVTIYIIDQLKNKVESDVLSFVYGINFVQVSLFSNEIRRDMVLKEKFKPDRPMGRGLKYVDVKRTYSPRKKIPKYDSVKKILDKYVVKVQGKLERKNLIDEYRNEILPDVSHGLIEKDFKETSKAFEGEGSGQSVSTLFHKSHYFFNLDLDEEIFGKEVKKFVELTSGAYLDYPTQDEFGMSLAYQASVRSNFPGRRHVGASIISESGEVISVASIRAPSPSSNTTWSDQLKVQDGYDHYKDRFEELRDFLEEENENRQDAKFQDIRKILEDTLDFHPCTHAEVAAIIDAAKLGVSISGATLYTTTFPCHLCAKEIISANIKRVVYLEAYPKSKNKELYFDLIHIDRKNKSDLLLSFDFFMGVGPRRYLYVYSLKNKPAHEKTSRPPLIRFEFSKYYANKEEAVLNNLELIEKSHDLDELMNPE